MIYIDDARHAFGRMKMCHMIADSTEELIAFAESIGVGRHWIQAAGTYRVHFDICMSKRKAAVDAGAVEITQRQLGRILRDRRLRDVV